jgi:preprotein translocase subunit YajC
MRPRPDQPLPFAVTGEQRTCVGTGIAAIFTLADPASGAGGSLPLLLPLLLIPVLYLMLFRPQQKRQKQWQEMLAGLKTGDRITTAGGLRGTILNIKDDTIVIRVPPDNIKLEVAKNAIASVTTQEPASGS